MVQWQFPQRSPVLSMHLCPPARGRAGPLRWRAQSPARMSAIKLRIFSSIRSALYIHTLLQNAERGDQ